MIDSVAKQGALKSPPGRNMGLKPLLPETALPSYVILSSFLVSFHLSLYVLYLFT